MFGDFAIRQELERLDYIESEKKSIDAICKELNHIRALANPISAEIIPFGTNNTLVQPHPFLKVTLNIPEELDLSEENILIVHAVTSFSKASNYTFSYKLKKCEYIPIKVDAFPVIIQLYISRQTCLLIAEEKFDALDFATITDRDFKLPSTLIEFKATQDTLNVIGLEKQATVVQILDDIVKVAYSEGVISIAGGKYATHVFWGIMMRLKSKGIHYCKENLLSLLFDDFGMAVPNVQIRILEILIRSKLDS